MNLHYCLGLVERIKGRLHRCDRHLAWRTPEQVPARRVDLGEAWHESPIAHIEASVQRGGAGTASGVLPFGSARDTSLEHRGDLDSVGLPRPTAYQPGARRAPKCP
jgi:hypothetical protein